MVVNGECVGDDVVPNTDVDGGAVLVDRVASSLQNPPIHSQLGD